MKTIIKLVFLGIVIAIAVNYLDKNDIDVLGEAKTILVRVMSEIDKLSDVQDTEKASPAVDFFSDNAEVAYQPYPVEEDSYADHYARPVQDIEITDERTDYTEFNIPRSAQVLPGSKPSRFREQDEYAASVPAGYRTDMNELVRYLVIPAGNDLEKTRIIFTWIALNISYDDEGYNTGNYSDCSPEGVFRSGRAVCQGYSELFERMGKMAGLEIVLVIGYAKGISYRPGRTFAGTNHAWNAVKIDGQWRLFDVTWAAGHGTGVNGRLVSVQEFDDYWFDADPAAFLFSHLPEDPQWQLNARTISKTQFENLPYVYSAYFRMGFDGELCLQNALDGNLTAFPEAFFVDGPVQATSLPYQEHIAGNQAYRFSVNSSCAADMAVINNGSWVHLKKNGDEFSAVIMPQPGELSVNVKFDTNERGYSTLLKYQVD